MSQLACKSCGALFVPYADMVSVVVRGDETMLRVRCPICGVMNEYTAEDLSTDEGV